MTGTGIGRRVRRGMIIGLLAMAPGAAAAVELACDDPRISVMARDEALARTACAAAEDARDLMATCGLVQQAPLKISVVRTARHPGFGTCLATYDKTSGCLEITELEGILPLLEGKDARAALPPDVLFRAITAHELAHAFVAQSTAGVQIGPAEHEFIANVFEMMSFDPEWRELLLDAHPVDPPGALSVVHPTIYALSPRAFANNAWRVFQAKGNGCDLIQRIIAGKFLFPAH
jgi:hypothetical protein